MKQIRNLLDLKKLRIILEAYTEATGIELFLVETVSFLKLISTELESNFIITTETQFDIIEKTGDINWIQYKNSIYAQVSLEIQGEEVLKFFAGQIKVSTENQFIKRESLVSAVTNFRGVINSMIELYDPEGYLFKTFNDLEVSDISKEDEELKAILSAIIRQSPSGIVIAYPDDMEFIPLNSKPAEIINDLNSEKWPWEEENEVQHAILTPQSYGTDKYLYKIYKKSGEEFKFEELPLSQSILEKKVLKDVEMLLVDTSTGLKKWLLVSSAPILNSDGEVIVGVTVFVDITERKQAEETIKKITKELEVRNQILEEKQHELLSQNELLQAQEEQLVFQNKKLSDQFADIHNSRLLLQESYEKLKYSEYLFKEFFTNMLEASIIVKNIFDENGELVNVDFVDANKAAEKFYGLTKEEMINMKISGLYGGAKTPYLHYLKQIYETKNPIVFDSYHDYTKKYIHGAFIPLNNETSAVIALDVSDTKRKEEELQEKNILLEEQFKKLEESEKKYRSVFTHMNESLLLGELLYDEHGEVVDTLIIDVNRRAEKLFNILREKLLGMRGSQLYKDGKSPYLRIIENVAITGEPVTFETYFEPIGIYGLLTVFSYEKNKYGVLGIDITDRKNAEEEKNLADFRFKAISEYALDPIMMCNDKYEVVYWNIAAEKQFGYKAEEIIGKVFVEYLLPDELHHIFAWRMEEVQKTGTTDIIGAIIERPMLKKDKSTFIAEISVSKVQYEDSVFFVGFFRDITQRKALEKDLLRERENLEQIVKKRTEELQDSLVKLEIANKHKDKFLANMSHELRTPLNAIIGFTQSLSLQYFGTLNDKQAEYINLITSSGQHLLALINDLLDITKIDAGAMEVYLSCIELKEFFHEVVGLMSNQFAHNIIKLDYTVDSSIECINTDKKLLKQIILNLLSNALKFTPSGGRVDVTVSKNEDNELKIIVQDTGIGIKKEEQTLIFSEFYQLEQVLDKKMGGTGIGLALTKRLVHLLGGEINVESEPGEGSTFWFTLPLE